jgi:hypothetical protein
MLWSEEEEYWSNMFLSGQEHMTHSLIHPPTRQPNFAVGSLEYLFYNIIFREYHMTHSLTHPFWSKERKQGRKEGEREGGRGRAISLLPPHLSHACLPGKAVLGGWARSCWSDEGEDGDGASSPSESMSNMREARERERERPLLSWVGP